MNKNLISFRNQTAGALTVFVTLALNLAGVHSIRAADVTWTGGGTTTDNWSDSGNWDGVVPAANDALFFDGGVRLTPNNDLTAGTAFNGIVFNSGASAFTLGGNSVLLSGQAAGIVNNSVFAQTIHLNLADGWGYYTFSSPAGGSLVLDGTLTLAPASVADFDANVTSSSLGTDDSGLILGLGGAGLFGNTAVGGGFTGLATVNGGAVTAYAYGVDQQIAADGIVPSATNNIELIGDPNTAVTLAGGGGNTFVNTILVTADGTGNKAVTINDAGMLVLGTDVGGGYVGGIYVPNVATGNKQAVNLNGGNVTAGPMTGAATPGEIIFAVNGTTTGNQMEMNSTIQDNGSGGAVTVVKAGTGSMYFNTGAAAKPNTYSGGTYVDQGYLQVNQPFAFGTGPVYVASGATVFPNNVGPWTNDFFLSPGLGYPGGGTGYGAIRGGTTTYAGTMTLLGSPATNAGAADRFNFSGSPTISGQITGSGTLEFYASGNSTLTFSNVTASANDWTGGLLIDEFNNNNSAVRLGADDQLAGNSVTLVQAATGYARLDLNGFNDSISGLNSSGGSTLNQVGNFGAGTATLTVGAGDATASFDGVIGGGDNINLVKIGTGTQTLAGASTYTGTTTISNGVLALSGSGALGGTTIMVGSAGTFDVSQLGAFTLSGGAILSGSGTVTGNVDAASGSTIRPGGDTTLHFANDLTLEPGSIGLFNLAATTNGANDHVVVAGNLTLNGGTISINAAALQPLGRYKLIAYSGAKIGTVAGLSPFYMGSQIVSLDDSIPGEIDLVVQAGSVPNLAWRGDGLANVWDLNGTANWANNGAGGSVFQNGDFVTFDDGGSKSPDVNLVDAVQPVSLLVSNNTGIYTFSGGGHISGGTSLNKQGAGALVLQESGMDDFSGGILVGGGSLVLSNTTMNISGGISVTNGTLVDTDNGTINGGLTLNSGSAYVTGYGVLNGDIINHDGTVIVSGSGTFNGAINNVSGSTTVSNYPNINGDVMVADGLMLLDQTSIPYGNTIINGGVLQVGNNDENGYLPNGTILNNGSLVFSRNDMALSVDTVISGTGSLTQNGPGTVTLTAIEAYTGVTTVNGGILVLNAGNHNPSGLASSSALIINTNASVQVGIDNSLVGSGNPGPLPVTINAGGLLTGVDGDDAGAGTSAHIKGLLTLNGGTLSNSGTSINAKYGAWNLDNGVAVNTGPNFTTTSTIDCLSVIPDQAGGTVFDVLPGSTLSGIDLLVSGSFINGTSTHDTGIIKTGAGTMALNNDNTYIGATVISNGTLQVNGSLVTNSAVTVAPAGRLAGTGIIGGAVTVNGTIAPGLPAAIGTLNCSSTVTLNGMTLMKLDQTSETNDVLAVAGGLVYGGTLNVTNLAGTLSTSDAFQLFSTPGTGAFASIVPATPGDGLAWDTSTLTTDGTLRIKVGSAVNTDPATANFQATAAGGSLQFSWASDHQGWQLYTNAAGLTATDSWFPVPGSASVTSETIAIDPANPNVFFQLRYP